MRFEHPQFFVYRGNNYLFFNSTFLLALFVTVVVTPNSPSTCPMVVYLQ